MTTIKSDGHRDAHTHSREQYRIEREREREKENPPLSFSDRMVTLADKVLDHIVAQGIRINKQNK